LLTNALKYAFPENREGLVKVRFKDKAEHLLLEVSDNGIGMAVKEGKSAKGGFGLKLIDTFAKKLKADLEIKREEGTTVRLMIHNYTIAQ